MDTERKKTGRPKGITGGTQKIEAERNRQRAAEAFEANLTFADRLIYEGAEDRTIAKSLAALTKTQISETMVRERRYKLNGRKTAV